MKKLRDTSSQILKVSISLGVCFLLLGGSALLSSYNDKQIDQYGEQIRTLGGTINTAQNELAVLPGIEDIELQQKGAVRGYIDDIKKITIRIKPESYPKVHKTLWAPIENNRIQTFNQTVGSEAFATALHTANDSLSQTVAALEYHTNVMSTLANVLEYNPAVDTSAASDQVIMRIAAAGQGISNTLDSLDKASGYEDTEKSQLRSYIADIEAARFPYFTALTESRAAESEKQAYIAVVRSAQEKIMTNRQAFWEGSQEKQLLALSSASGIVEFGRQLD